MSDSTTVPVRPGITDPAEGAGKPSFPFRAAEEHRNGRSIGSIWFRMVLLLAALLATKLIMIFGQGESLYELHWRLGGLRPNWVNDFAFFSFIALGGFSLIALEKSCRSEEVRAVRTVNAVVVAMGLIFLFLTFHNGDKNLLYPILSGVLKWTSLCSYSANNLFFNQPFLAGWVFVYAFAYYVLARTGRENRVLSLTASFAVAYGLVNLRDFAQYRDQLLVIDCAGTVSLIAVWIFPRRLRVGWLLLPIAWVSFFVWALLRFDNEWHSNAAVYFLSLAGVTLALFALATLLVRRFGNPIAWSWMLPFFFIGFFLLADTNYPSSRNYNHLLFLAFAWPRYFCGDLALVSCLGVIALVLCKKWPRAGLGFLDFSALALMLLSIVDLRLSQIIGVRLGWDVLAFGDSPRMMLKMARPYLPGVVLGLIALVALYALALRLVQVWSKHASRRSTEPARETAFVSDNLNPSHSSRKPEFSAAPRSFLKFPGLAFVVMIFVIMGLLGVAIAESDKSSGQTVVRLIRTSPLWKRVANHPLSEPEFIRSATALGLGDFSLPRNTSPAGPSRDLNVLVVFMESSYNKHLSLFGSTEDTQPELSRYKDRMELFPNFFSAFTGSIHARFATFTSLYPSLDFHAFTQERVPVKSLFEVLHDHGYTCSMFYSSFFDYTGFRDFLKNRGLDEMYDADTMPGQRSTQRVAWGLLEEETLGAIRGQLKKYAASQQRFFLTYVPAAPHYPYDKIPKAFQRHKMGDLSDFTPLYLNELLYMDWVIASIIDELKESGLLDNTLVVITNDHGEMVGGKDGHVGHGWAVTPQLANTPLIIMDPARHGFQANTTVGNQVDLLPTILDRLNIPIPADQLYEGLSLDAGAAREGRLSYLNSYKEFGIVSGAEVLLGDREASNPSGVASTGAVYKISNEGTATVFTLQTDETKKEDPGAPTTQSGPKASLDLVEPGSDSTSTELVSGEARKTVMARFDAFQANLLRNYDFYSRLLRTRTMAQVGPAKTP